MAMVKKLNRTAQVGEWIEITPDKADDNRYSVGDIFRVTHSSHSTTGDSGVCINTPAEQDVFVFNYEYVVLQRRKITPAAISAMAWLFVTLVGMIIVLLLGKWI